MNDPLDQVITLAQQCVSQVPVIVLGSGASAQYGIGGMGALQKHLLTTIKPANSSETDVWNLFAKEILNGVDLETALHNVHLPPSLEARVVDATREMVLQDDLQVLQNVANGTVQFALSSLLKHLLRTTQPKIQIVTTNYDRLAEYACDTANARFDKCFDGGFYRSFQTNRNHNSEQIVEILKVHGSLDWFMDGNQSIIALPDSVKPPSSYTPLLVTPGTGKYAITHDEPFRSIITRSDSAFASARAALCIGYGFNDRHIQPKLTNRILKDRVPLLILAHTLTAKTREFLAQCKHANYLALECRGSGSRAYYADHSGGIDLNEPIWQFSAILTYLV